ncbi:MAG: liaR 6 [Acidimicrobiales bacterium]|jgi:CheY-like chemotaxis protein|nr:liaR 6 [Acidimicrobiales bacterium]
MRLVVADNDAAVIDLLTLDMKLEGHDIVGTAMSGAAAVEACTRLAPEVLIVDLRLGPGPDGIDVAGEVRRPDLRVILHTNYVSAETIARARRVGAVVVEKGSLRALRRAVRGEGWPATT